MTHDVLASVWTHLSHAVIERGEGIYVYDQAGNQYIDFTSGIGVTNTGHCHPRVVAAIQKQATQLLFGQINCVIPEPTLALAKKLRSVLPENLNSIFFSNSGAEAVEGAIKLAKVATSRTNIIAFQGGFHGRTALAMALTGSKTIYRAGFQPLPAGVFFAPFPYAYRYGWDEQKTVDFCLHELDLIFRSQTAPHETAAIIIEPVLGEGGYVPVPPPFLQALRQLCDEYGILLIFDEIQSGFGRTGSFWAHMTSAVNPDILIMAKGIASGMPLSAFAAAKTVMDKLPPGSHGGTYGGGNAVVMAAACATLDTLLEDDLVNNAQNAGAYLLSELRSIQAQYPVIGDVRGVGLMIATEFTADDGEPAPEIAKSINQYCEANGLLLLTCGSYGNVVRWIPPLIVTPAQIDDALAIFKEALQYASSH